MAKGLIVVLCFLVSCSYFTTACDLGLLAQPGQLWYYAFCGTPPSTINDFTKIQVSGVQTAVVIDYDEIDGYVYWTDVAAHKISRAKLDGSYQKTLYTVGRADGLVLDKENRMVYWTDTDADKIEKGPMSGDRPINGRQALVSTGLREPRAIVLDLQKSQMYWTDWGHEHIKRSALDGTHHETLVTKVTGALRYVNGLTLDLDQQLMYWAHYGKIEVANLDGTNRRNLWTQTGQPFFIELYGKHLYWTDWIRQSLERISTSSPTHSDRLLSSSATSRFMGIRIVKDANVTTTNTNVTTTESTSPITEITNSTMQTTDSTTRTTPSTMRTTPSTTRTTPSTTRTTPSTMRTTPSTMRTTPSTTRTTPSTTVSNVTPSGGYNCDPPKRNPCIPPPTDGDYFLPHEDPAKYVRCDAWGNCYNKECAAGLVWDDDSGPVGMCTWP